MKDDHWRVEVFRDGENILTIEHASLAGKSDLTEDDLRIIRLAGDHLHGFAGTSVLPDTEMDRGAFESGFGFGEMYGECPTLHADLETAWKRYTGKGAKA